MLPTEGIHLILFSSKPTPNLFDLNITSRLKVTLRLLYVLPWFHLPRFHLNFVFNSITTFHYSPFSTTSRLMLFFFYVIILLYFTQLINVVRLVFCFNTSTYTLQQLTRISIFFYVFSIHLRRNSKNCKNDVPDITLHSSDENVFLQASRNN